VPVRPAERGARGGGDTGTVPSTLNKVLVVLAAVGTLAVYGGSVVLTGIRDGQDTLDSRPVRDRASAACTALRLDVDAEQPLPSSAGRDARLARLAEQDRLVARLVADVRGLGPAALAEDVPAEQWLADWEQLAAARRAYGEAGAQGAFVVPVEDGRPITYRMDRVGVPACVVPTGLTIGP